MDDSPPQKDWGNVGFRPATRRLGGERSPDEAWARFVIGVLVFVGVAAIYPWYSYSVQSRLIAKDAEATAEVLGQQAAELEQRLAQQWSAAQPQPVQTAMPAPTRMVRVVGVSQSRSGPVAIVELDGAEPDGYVGLICRQASLMLRTSVEGRPLRIQRHRGNSPAQEAGRVLFLSRSGHPPGFGGRVVGPRGVARPAARCG